MKEKKLKVLIVTYFDIELPGGVESMIRPVIRSGGSNVQFVVLASCKKEIRGEQRKGYLFYGTPLLLAGSDVDESKMKNVLLSVDKEFGPGIVHGHNLSYMFDLEKVEIIFNFFKKKDCVMIEHAHHAFLKRKKRAKRIINLDWDKIISVSHFAGKRMKKTLKDENKEKLMIIQDAIDLSFFRSLPEKEKKRRLLQMEIKKRWVLLFPSRPVRISTGKIGKQKQLITVFHALSLLKKKGFHDFCLVVPHIENRRNKDGFCREAEKHNLLPNVRIFPEKLKQEDMYKFYGIGDVVIFPSLKESFGLVSLEAMAMRKPLIAARSGGITEIVKHKANGLLFNSKESADLAEKIEELMGSGELRRKIVERGAKDVQEHSMKNYIEKIKSVWLLP